MRILTNIYLHLYIDLIHYATSATTIEKNIHPLSKIGTNVHENDGKPKFEEELPY